MIGTVRRLSGDGCKVVELWVVVQDRERGGLGDCGDEEIGDLASLESIGGKLTSADASVELVNGQEPAVGRAAIADIARGFYEAFPDTVEYERQLATASENMLDAECSSSLIREFVIAGCAP